MQPRTVVKVEAEEPSLRLAVLIDADNAQPAVIEALLEEVASLGEATVRRIYGDFTAPTSSSWKKVLNKYSIKPMQQFAYTTGKNATDSTMIIDAMDLLYTRRFEGFCLVSSDSDFTGLAVRLREEGLQVYGFGESKTPEAFRNACHKFVLTELLRKPASEGAPPVSSNGTKQPSAGTPPDRNQTTATDVGQAAFPETFIMEALEKSADDSGWAHLGTFGSYLQKIQPDFDSRLYGFKKLSDLVRAKRELFETEERQPPGGGGSVLYIRARAPR